MPITTSPSPVDACLSRASTWGSEVFSGAMAADDKKREMAQIRARLREEGRQMVERVERALAAAPDDPELHARLQAILDEARALRDMIELALERSSRRDEAAKG